MELTPKKSWTLKFPAYDFEDHLKEPVRFSFFHQNISRVNTLKAEMPNKQDKNSANLTHILNALVYPENIWAKGFFFPPLQEKKKNQLIHLCLYILNKMN